jgi:hypothetical protein
MVEVIGCAHVIQIVTAEKGYSQVFFIQLCLEVVGEHCRVPLQHHFFVFIYTELILLFHFLTLERIEVIVDFVKGLFCRLPKWLVAIGTYYIEVVFPVFAQSHSHEESEEIDVVVSCDESQLTLASELSKCFF